MKIRTLGFFGIALLGLCSLAAKATTISVEANIRGDSRYYVNAWDLKPSDLRRVGLVQAPGLHPNDDEGYCRIDGSGLPSGGGSGGIIKKGEILTVIKEFASTRRVVDGLNVVEITDTFTVAALKNGQQIGIGCSIDSGASERVPYLPVTSNYTKAYLTLLHMFVGQ